MAHVSANLHSGQNVEDAFLETAKQIFQNIQDGSLDLNAAETGVQQRDTASGGLGKPADDFFYPLVALFCPTVPLNERPQPKQGCC